VTLTTEESGDMPDVVAAAMDGLLACDGFGKFAVLSASDEAFIQAGNDWQPGPECEEFMATHDSDPWVLEYRDGARQFQAAGRVTLDQVRQAFGSYLAGGPEWRSGFAWGELEL
jgi:hypothetical protein